MQLNGPETRRGARPQAGEARALARLASTSLLVVFLYGCTGGLSCGGQSSCINGYAYPQTQATVPNGVQPVDDGVRMRLTQQGLDFLSVHLKDLMLAVFDEDPRRPGTLRLDIGPIDIYTSNPTVRIGQGPEETYPTGVLIDADRLEQQLTLDFAEGPDGIRIRASDVPVGLDARIFGEYDTGFGSPNAACDIYGTQCPPGDPNCGLVTTLSFDMRVIPDVGVGSQCDLGQGECLLVRVEFDSFALGTIDSGSMAISVPPHVDVGAGDANGCTRSTAPDRCSPTCSDRGSFDPFSASQECDLLCGGADLLADIALELSGVLVGIIEPLMANLLEQGVRQALADFDGSPLAASSRLDLAAAVPGLLSPTTLDLGYSVGPTGNAFDVNCPSGNCPQNRGMDIILKSGFEAAPDPDGAVPVPHPCAIPYTGVSFNELYYGSASGPGEFETENSLPLTGLFQGQPYHLGASLAEPAVNQILFAAYNTGALCIELSTEGVHALTGGKFNLSAGTIDLLTEGKLRQFAAPSAPALVAINPVQPPVVTFGAGTQDEGHLIVSWPDVEVSFYVLMYERYARVFAVEADISMGLTVFNDPETQTLHISVVDGPTVDGFEETYNELLPGVDFTEILESLVGLVFDTALGDGLSFDYDVANALSDAIGVPLYIDFRGIETLPAGSAEFLNVYLSLTETPPQPLTAPVAPVQLSSTPGLYDAPVAPRIGGDRPAERRMPTGEVVITGQDAPLDPEMEYFALVDFGGWKGPFRVDERGDLVVRDPKLALIGLHTIKLRGRTIGEPNSLEPDADAPQIVFWVDPEAPRAEMIVDERAARASGSDVGTRPEDLLWSWREDDAAWSDFAPEASRDLDDLDDVRRLSVRARDLAGNVSQPFTVDLGAARASLRAQGKLGRFDDVLPGGCQAAGGSPAAALALFALLLRRRRPQR